jgi:hypothetical protein
MVTDIRGDVLVNRGVGFVAVREAVELAPGDLVLAGAAGSARVDFGKGCAVPVQPGQIVRVSVEPPCRPTNSPDGSNGEKPSTATLGSSITPSAMVIGGLAVAGGAGLALGLAGGGGGGGSGANQNRPVSP